MGYFDDFKSFLLRKPTSDPHVDTDQEYVRHRNEAAFQHSPTGRMIREIEASAETQKPIQKITKEQAKQKPAETQGPVDERPIDIHSGKPVGSMPEITPEMIQREQAAGQARGAQMLQRNLQDTSASAEGVMSAQPPTLLDSVINVMDYPAANVRQAIAEAINKQHGTNLNADTVSKWIAEKSAPGDPIGQAINELLTGILTDPANYVPVIGLPLSAYKGLGKLADLSKAAGVDLVSERGSMYGKELTKPLAEVGKPDPDQALTPIPFEQWRVQNPGVDPTNADLAYQEYLQRVAESRVAAGLSGSLPPAQLPTPAEVPVFYSPTERVIEAKLPNSATPAQVMGTLQGAGIPMDEAKWMDIEGFMRGKKSVSKQELLDFVRMHRVQLEEVRLGEPSPEAAAQIRQLDAQIAHLEEQHRAYVEQKRAEHEAAEDARIAEAQARGEDPLPEGATLFDDLDEYVDNLEEHNPDLYNEFVEEAQEEANDAVRNDFDDRLSRWTEDTLDDESNHEYKFEFEDYTAYGNDEHEYWTLSGPDAGDEDFRSLEEVKQRIAELVAKARRAEDSVDETTRQLTLEGKEEGSRVPIDEDDERYSVDAILENELGDDVEDLGIPEHNQRYVYKNDETGDEITGNDDIGWHYNGRDYRTLEEAKQAVYADAWDNFEGDNSEAFAEALNERVRQYRSRLRHGYQSLPDNIYVRGMNAPEDGTIRQPFIEPKNADLVNLKRQRERLQAQATIPTQYHSYRLPGGQNYREFLLKIPQLGYRAPHFGSQANDLASHFRVSDRFVDVPDGEVAGVPVSKAKRVLVVEEIQSDLNQAGRERGFRDLEKAVELEKQAEAAKEEWRFWRDKYSAADGGSSEREEADKREKEAFQHYLELSNKAASARSGPPLTPFAKSWHELAIKRIIRLAAEEGYDTVAWTTGEQQGKRYDVLLQQNIDTLSWSKNSDGTYNLALYKNGLRVFPTNEELMQIPVDRLRHVVGAEIAEQIKNADGFRGKLTGQDLTIGASGMKGFYDDMLPKMVSKYVKKWEGKVGQIDLGRNAWDEAEHGKAVLHSVEITPKMAEAVLNNPQSLLGSAFQTIEEHLRLLPKMIQQQLREKLPPPKTWKKLDEEGGYFALGPSMFLARTIIGALAGAVAGDEEDAIRNALVGAGLGAIASPALVGKLVNWARTAKAAKAQPPVFRPTTDFKAFLDARGKVERQEYLTPLTEQDLAVIVAKGGKVMLSQDGTIGYILTAEGDLQSVFNGGPAGMGKYAVKDAIKRGAKTLDAFDGFLPNYYRQFGFLETGRVPFDPNLAAPGVEQALGGRPDVVFMAQATPLHEYQAMYRQLVDNARSVVAGGKRADTDVKLEGDLLADYGIINEESIKKLYPGSTMNDAQIYALHRVLTESGKKVLELAQNVTDDVTMQEFLKAFYVHGMLLDPKRLGIEAEAGRSLRMYGTEAPVDVQGMQNFLNQFSDVMGTVKEGMSPLRLVDMVKEFKTPEQMAVFAKNAVKPGLKDAILNLWVNSLLSGPHTHVANILGNGATLTWAIAERQIAGVMAGEIRPSEAAAMVKGVFESFGDALRLGWEVMKRGDEAAMFSGKVEQRTRVSFEDVGLTGVPGKALDYLSAFFEGMGGRTLLATDEFFKAIAFRAEVRARALREAYNVVNAEGLTGKAARQRVDELVEKYMTDIPEDIQKDAEKFSAYVTFTKGLGPTGQWLADGSANHPAVKLILPFVKAPINIFKFAGERTPFALLHKSFWNEIRAGGSRAELALSKISMGAMIAGLGVLWASEGIITGGGPQNKKLKDLKAVMQEGGWQPYSINVSALKRMSKGQSTEWQKGDQFISYNRVEPLGMLFGLYANYVEIVANKETDETWDEVASNLVMGTVKAMASKTFIKGLSQTAMAFMFPDEFLGDTLNKQAVSFVPVVGSSLSRKVAQQVDPVLREAEGFMQELMKNTPGLSRTLPPTLHPISGEPVYRQGALGPDFASPLYQSIYKKDRVIEELTKQKVPVHPPSKTLFGVPLSQEGYVELQHIITHEVKSGGRNLHDALEHLMDSPAYKNGQDGPEGRKALLLRSMIAKFQEAGKVKMLKKHPELKQAVRDFYKEHAAKLKSIPLPPSDDAVENADVDLDALEVAGQ